MKYLMMVVIVMSGCSSKNVEEGPTINSSLKIIIIDVNNNKLTCVKWNGFDRSGLSCNWDDYNK